MYTWSAVIGHDHAKDVLQRALRSDHLHHALLFAGPPGVGKRLLATTLAAALNCTASAEERPCGACRACAKIQHQTHPDLLVEEPQGKSVKTLKIQQIRDLQRICHAQPYEGRARVVILDDAHSMSEEASNALLKTLEEPHADTHLVLVTHQLHLMLPTIRSRCQLVRFGALEQPQVITILQKLAQKHEASGEDPVDQSETTLRMASLLGEGSPGNAWSLLESGMIKERRELIDQLAMLDRRHPLELLKLAEEMARDRVMAVTRLELIKLFLRDVMLYLSGASTERLLNQDMEPVIHETARSLGLEQVDALLGVLTDAQERITRNVNPQLVMERVLRAMVSPDRLDLRMT